MPCVCHPYRLLRLPLTPRDLHITGVIFQHGNCPEHFLLASRLADAARQAGYVLANWIYAAAIDRYQMSQNEPQRYGTQYTYEKGKFRLYSTNPATTDEDRHLLGLPPYAVAEGRACALSGDFIVLIGGRLLVSWWLLLMGVAYAALALAAMRLPRIPNWIRWTAIGLAVATYLASIVIYRQEIIVLAQQPQSFSPIEQMAGIVLASGIIGLFVLGAAAWFKPPRPLPEKHGESG